MECFQAPQISARTPRIGRGTFVLADPYIIVLQRETDDSAEEEENMKLRGGFVVFYCMQICGRSKNYSPAAALSPAGATGVCSPWSPVALPGLGRGR